MTGSKLSVEAIRRAVAVLKKNRVEPGCIKTKAEAREQNRKERKMFGKTHAHHWKAGDEYYTLYPRGIK